MKRFIPVVMLFVLCAIFAIRMPHVQITPAAVEETTGCNANFTPLIAPSEKLGTCILQAAISDLVEAIQDPLSLIPAIISSCLSYGEATAAQIIAIIEQAIATQPMVDGGVLSTVQLSRLHKVHAAALTMMHVVIVKPDAGVK